MIAFLYVFLLGLNDSMAATTFKAQVKPHSSMSVKVTSFYGVNSNGRLAELCGRIEGNMPQSAVSIKITADPRSKRSGIYNVLVYEEGKFCTTLVTYYGEADLEIR